MSKELVFKVVLQADNKDYVSNVKQSEDVTKAVVKAIKDEADKLRQTSTDTAKEIGNLVPESTTKMASALTQNLTNATTAIKGAGINAGETAKNFAEFGRVSEKALSVLKSDLDQAKQKLQALSTTKATPQDIARAQTEVDKLEKEVIQADQAFNKFSQETSKANQELKQTSSVSDKARAGFSSLRTGATLLVGALAAIGVGLGVREIAEAADSYAMLSAKIQQSTKDSGNFQQAIASVHQIALQTNSTLDATAGLFTKLNIVAKDMGQTQQYALDMTSTVTKAIQLGGGSAQASEAAVQQFIQAMQGGVLRGEEFNSIMENGYGLAEALAKGLGVTTGELRKMAEAGELSAERVLGALSKQKTAVDAQYAELPLTIGNALQKIATSWQILIGEMDQANGASATVAQWLSTLADNLDVVEVLLRDIGGGFVWFGDQLKRIDPQTIEALKTALLSAYEAVKSLAATISTGFEVTIDLLNTTLGQLLSFSSGIDSAADKTNGFTKALQAVNVVFGFLKDGFSGVSIAGSLLVGMFYSMAAAWEKVKSKFTWGDTKQQILAEMQEMEDKSTYWFNKASQGVTEFKSAGIEAIRQISLTQTEKDAETVASSKAKLDKLLADQKSEVDGKIASEGDKLAAVKKYAEAAIKANGGVMDGTMQADLMTKGYIVTLDETGKVAVKAWDVAATGANKTSNETDKARKAAAALGIDLYELRNGITESFNNGSKALTDFAAGLQGLGIEGKQAADVTYQAWLKWLETAKSQKEIDVATFKLKEFGDQGKISTEQVEQGLIRARFQAQKIPDDLDPVIESFKRLGIETKENLKLAAQQAMMDFINVRDSGKATAEGVEKAYRKALDAAAASGDQVAISTANAAGAGRNLEIQMDATGKASVKSMDDLSDSVDRVGRTARGSAADGFRELGRVAREEAKSTADEWIDAMAKIDAERKAKDASNNKGLSELQGGIDQMAQDYYDRLVAAGMDQSRARDLADKARYSLAVETTTSLKGGTTQNMNTTKQEMEKTLAYWENRNSSKSGSGSISAIDTSASISAPNIQAPIIEPTKAPSVETSPAKNVSIQLSYAGYSAELSGTQDQVDAAEELFRQLEEAKKRS
ncbi:tape measure protein [Acinetobacter venetianus]|uniref:tape measure protein n=1 Tax=Acinetobacter venetianus TaxID=52133 RepID=UPI00289FD230|nr:tape measure protein [Acinetobacter venetianus]